ncbi:NAD(P)/FAD-dependent oxidoreductase [Antarctobacter sp.]|uniref:flavin-dependent monooxygenase QhpG n=1 Tax=Antarctobacter sp. TaxID=1872577 RepID=UPI002B264C62|nr:tryptophan 7-halogenase [Antarctobacter sp.]
MNKVCSPSVPDIAIAGGGPAGAIAAILLTRAGARVTLVDGAPRTDWVEGAGARLVTAMRAQNLALEGLGPMVERRVTWGDLTGIPNREHILSRRAFDAGLRAQAEAEGVTRVNGTVAKVQPGAILLADGRCIAAGLVFEARGRRARTAPGRKRGVPTVSISAPTQAVAPGAEVIAHVDGWIWRISDGVRGWSQVTVDADAASDPAQVWRDMIGFDLPASARVTGAELRLSAPDLDPDVPRLGDAAVAMDPLSGHGLFWALASALMAAPLAEALLGGRTDMARRFYKDRVVATFDRQARVGRDFYRAAGLDGPFWQARRIWPDDIPAEPVPPAAAFLERRVVVRGGRLAETNVLITPQEPEGVAFVGGIEIGPVLALLRHGTLPDKDAFARHILTDAPPETAFRIHDWLTDRGIPTAPAPNNKEVTS